MNFISNRVLGNVLPCAQPIYYASRYASEAVQGTIIIITDMKTVTELRSIYYYTSMAWPGGFVPTGIMLVKIYVSQDVLITVVM